MKPLLIRVEADQRTLLEQLQQQDAPPMPAVKRKVLDYQMLALFVLARQYDRRRCRLLEIGTGHGGSGYMLAKAAPQAAVLSLTNVPNEAAEAARFWKREGCRNVKAHAVASWDYLSQDARLFDFIFVDGDHNRIRRDLPWFNRLRPGGLLLCHDYSPADSRTPSAIVYAELDAMASRLGRPFDVRIIDEGKVGMVGFYRQAGEVWA